MIADLKFDPTDDFSPAEAELVKQALQEQMAVAWLRPKLQKWLEEINEPYEEDIR